NLPRRHYRGRIDSFIRERAGRRGGWWHELGFRYAPPPGVDKLAQTSAADGVQYQMHALVGTAVVDLMAAEGIEQPAFAGGHVHSLAAAGEQNVGIRDRRDVDPPMCPPVIMAIDV